MQVEKDIEKNMNVENNTFNIKEKGDEANIISTSKPAICKSKNNRPSNLTFLNTINSSINSSDAEECKYLRANYLTFEYSVYFFNVE